MRVIPITLKQRKKIVMASFRLKKQEVSLISKKKYERFLNHAVFKIYNVELTDYLLAKFNVPVLAKNTLPAFLFSGYYYIGLPNERALRVRAYPKKGVLFDPWRVNRNSRDWAAIRREQVESTLGHIGDSVITYKETEAYVNKVTVHQGR